MKKLIVLVTLVIFMMASFSTNAATQTQYQKIKSVLYNASTDYLYFIGESKWNDGSTCSNATYVRILPSLLGKKEILSIALSAHMAGKDVLFRGDCGVDNNDYYDAFYIIVN